MLRNISSGWLGAEQRWTVAGFHDAIACARQGLGFAFIPRHLLGPFFADGSLAPLPLEQGRERSVDARLVFADRENAGPGTLALAQLIIEECAAANGFDKDTKSSRLNLRLLWH